MSQLLKLREKMKKRRPRFLRQEVHRLIRFKNNPTWRKPEGKRSKMRTREAAKPKMPDIGWRGPAAVRGFHPSGVREVIIHNARELEGLGDDVIVKVSSTVGQKKKVEIVKEAQKRKVKVANPRFTVRLRRAEDIEDILSVKAYARFIVSPKATEEEKKKMEEAAGEHGITLEVVE